MYSAWVAPVGVKLSCVGAMCHPLSYTRPKTELAEEQRNLQQMISGMNELPSEYMDPGRRLHEELEERSLRNHIPSRSRSPCRNFFWKTFSTC
ncbi:somatostatin 6 [Centroberyx affinis]|uniref:somatostatin 6 n=1 Tax=Centroberyx affinis TaxID=166261 RepID=UPI003A5C3BA5